MIVTYQKTPYVDGTFMLEISISDNHSFPKLNRVTIVATPIIKYVNIDDSEDGSRSKLTAETQSWNAPVLHVQGSYNYISVTNLSDMLEASQVWLRAYPGNWNEIFKEMYPGYPLS
jgi:hypothetical protein